MQASDRQLTDARTRRLVTEHANKAVVWGGAATLAFTGLATIGSERADIWIAKHIREADDLPNGLADLCKAAKANGAIGGHALAVVGVGVVHNPNEKKDGAERIVPTVCWAANCLDEHGNPAQARRNGWTCGGRCLTNEPFLLHVAGQRLYQGEREQLEATIAKQLGDSEPPDIIAATLLGAIRAVAGDKTTMERRQRANTVGRGVQITCLPYAVIGPLVVGESEFGIWIPDDPPGLAGLEVGGHRRVGVTHFVHDHAGVLTERVQQLTEGSAERVRRELVWQRRQVVLGEVRVCALRCRPQRPVAEVVVAHLPASAGGEHKGIQSGARRVCRSSSTSRSARLILTCRHRRRSWSRCAAIPR